MNKTFGLTLAAFTLSGSLISTAYADDDKHYQVTITNLTHGQNFTPLLVASHAASGKLFELGQAPSDALAMMAEGGDTGPLVTELSTSGQLHDNTSAPGLLGPGESITLEINTQKGYDHISVAGMLIPTNDAFVALNSVKAPKGRHALTVYVPVYDAGSEINDELCSNIPGPYCGGAGYSPDPGEDFVHVHAGIHGGGSLDPAEFDWRNPAARIVIVRSGDSDN